MNEYHHRGFDNTAEIISYYEALNDKPPSFMTRMLLYVNLFIVTPVILVVGIIIYFHLNDQETVLIDKLHDAGLAKYEKEFRLVNDRVIDLFNAILNSSQPSEQDKKDNSSAKISKLEKIAYQYIAMDQWKRSDVEQFLTLWDSMTPETKRHVAGSIWYQQLAHNLQRNPNILKTSKVERSRLAALVLRLQVDEPSPKGI